ncbi:hypothetical protein SAMN02745136_01261 [Anaerocolumna jejuensis DSM 15929]|uniref:Uncharacterized protein n=1 Tax=Anaerocolumna jejuensis DSM 15929 TaxID=1121322 RepID=A0A1M6NCZ5_9FIRM|nr:DUF6115 domain-containing protein [Anaerocolumna jejuensis]SHJ93612.1 hypothetical protein SAMN02745136_01261 [Anaerocolumna jejuensis DSM 15929]
MGTLAIILIIIGIAIIIISCFMVDKTDKKSSDFVLDTALNQSMTDFSSDLKQKFEDACNETTEGYLFKADNQLSQLSNEKIIAVNDFSEQILEKIKHNHEEVVFLYNMLGEKEEDLKSLMKNADRQKKLLEEASAHPVAAENKAPQPKKNTSAKTEAKAVKPADNVETGGNSNQKILELYSNGFSIVDISKTLEIGQGEVKLVVDLYRENGKQQ